MPTVINLKVQSNFDAASADIKKFGAVTEAQRKKFEKFQKEFTDESIKKFNARLARSTAAVKATKGPLAAMKSEHKSLQKEIQRLIRNGIDPLDDSLKDLTTRYQRLDQEMEDVNAQSRANRQAAQASQGAFLALGAGAVIMGKRAVGAFIDISREASRAASDAEEIKGKFDVVFAAIGNDATMAAATIADDFDLAASTVNKLLGDTGDILTGLNFDPKTALELSKSVGTLALDLASFTNFAGGAEGASAALTKALLGEAESAKSLGIVIRQDTAEYKNLVSGIMETERVGLIQAKALAALQIITEQSKNAIGDYARTVDSSANVQKRLNETIKESKELYGVIVNEGLTPWRAGINETISSINKLIKTQILQNKIELGEASTVEKLILERQRLTEAETALERKSQTLAITTKQLGEATAAETGRMRSSSSAVENRIVSQQKAIETEKERIEVLNSSITEFEKQVQAENQAAQAAIDAAVKIQERSSLEAEAAEELKRLKFESLSQDEKALASLDDQIEKWREFEDIPGVLETINALLEKRAELLLGNKDLLSESFTEEQTAADERLSIMLSEEQAILDRETRIAEMKKDIADEELEEEEDRVKERKEMWIDFAFSMVSAVSGAFKLIDAIQQKSTDKELARIDAELAAQIAAITGETDTRTAEQKQIDALVENAERKKAQIEYEGALKSWKLQLALAIVSGAAAIVKGFAQLGPIGGAIAAIPTAIVTGVQVGLIATNKPQAPAFAEGGSFVTKGPQTITVGDNIGGEEEVTVNPVSSTGLNQGSGNDGGREEMILSIDGFQFRAWLIREFRDGNIPVAERALVS